jgi:hypothetical protein
MATACFLMHLRPFDDALFTNLEIMNEVIMVLLINIAFCFTDMLDLRQVYATGFLFVAVLCLCITVHLYFIFGSTADTVKNKMKQLWAKKKAMDNSPRVNKDTMNSKNIKVQLTFRSNNLDNEVDADFEFEIPGTSSPKKEQQTLLR